jgi:hypothetical protein
LASVVLLESVPGSECSYGRILPARHRSAGNDLCGAGGVIIQGVRVHSRATGVVGGREAMQERPGGESSLLPHIYLY